MEVRTADDHRRGTDADDRFSAMVPEANADPAAMLSGMSAYSSSAAVPREGSSPMVSAMTSASFVPTREDGLRACQQGESQQNCDRSLHLSLLS
jgi:hypothetical protein